MTVRQQELLSLFLRLAPIPGISRAERAIADEVTSILKGADIRVVEDDTARVVKGNAGNLLCFPRSFDAHSPCIMLTAHLDTVQSTSGLKVSVSGERVTSDGTTILGADNRMGVAILVDLMLKVAGSTDTHRNFFVVFTVCEESGLEGDEEIDSSNNPPTAAYVFDCSKRPGIFIQEAAGISTFIAEFGGRAAHAGVAPEEGVNAISLASAAIDKLKLGRLDADTTVNIGKIQGGAAVNIVPDKVVLEGEVRSESSEKIDQQLKHIEKTFLASVNGPGCVIFKSKSGCEPYVHASNSAAVVEVERAIRAVSLSPQPIRYSGGSDANVYNAKGIPAVNIGSGAQKPHSSEEFFLLSDLERSSKIAEELIRVDRE
jgi:tripeptide aminopeptidase